jgi:hypothetical protein
MTELSDLIPEKYRGYALFALAVSPYLTRAYHALANGGGIRGVFRSIWFGTNVDKNLTERVQCLECKTETVTKP